jgi:hypothetical protein
LIFACAYGGMNSYKINNIGKNFQYNTKFSGYVYKNRDSMYKFIREMYRDIYETDNYINKRNAYLFLQIARFIKTFRLPRDIAKIIANKILF